MTHGLTRGSFPQNKVQFSLPEGSCVSQTGNLVNRLKPEVVLANQNTFWPTRDHFHPWTDSLAVHCGYNPAVVLHFHGTFSFLPLSLF